MQRASGRSGHVYWSIRRTQGNVAVRHLEDNTWGNTLNERVGKEPVFTARVLAVEWNAIRRRTREAIEIRDRKTAINKNKGWRLG